MEVVLYAILVGLVMCIGLMVAVIMLLQKLNRVHKKAKPTIGLSREQQAKLREEATQQYEAMMVRELQRFEKSMQKFSDELLVKMQTHIGNPDVELEKTMSGLMATTTDGYSTALEQSVGALKARLSSVDALLTSHAQGADGQIQALVEDRKARALARADAELASIFSDYMAQVATGLDYGDQQAYILQQLEAIKPQLVEDIRRVG